MGSAGPQSILLAEDDDLLAANLVRQLAELGHTVIGPAADGQQALDLAREQRPDLAIMDIRMPVVSGLGAATLLYKQWGVPVILISAHATEQYVAFGHKLGVFGYLIKPVTVNELRVAIAVGWGRYCDQQRLQGELQDARQALEDRKYIERAKGLLMERRGLSESEAMQRLQQQARTSRRRLADLARAMVEADSLLRGDEQARS